MAQARRSRQPKRVEWGDEVYSSTDIQEIIAASTDFRKIVAATKDPIDKDRVKELSAALNHHAMYYLVYGTGRRKHVTETQFRKDMAQLRRKAAALGNVVKKLHPETVRVLEQAAAGNIFDFFVIRPVIDGAREWSAYLVNLSDEVDTTFSRRPPGPVPDVQLDALILELAKIYETYFKPAGRSRHWDTAKLGGPFIRFLQTCLRKIGVELGDEALFDRYKNVKKRRRDEVDQYSSDKATLVSSSSSKRD